MEKNKHYKIMAGFALDYYLETTTKVDSDKRVKDTIDDNVDTIISHIANVIENNVEKLEFKEKIESIIMGTFSDYMYHFMFERGVAKFDKEIEDFIHLSYQLSGKLEIENIIDTVLQFESCYSC